MRIGRTIPPAASPIYIRDIINGIKGLIRGRQELERFRTELKDHYNVKHCFLVSSGKAALTLILKALNELHPERDEVLIPAFICYSVPSAIVRAGLRVKLCDVDSDTLDYNFDELEKKMNPNCIASSEKLFEQGGLQAERSSNAANQKLLAVLSAHLFGLPADVGRVRNIVVDSGAVIVEDAAQAMGSRWQGKKLGILGDVGFFSLGRGKALSTVEGGIIITNRDDIGEHIKKKLKEIPGYDILELVKLIFNAFLLIVFQRPVFFWFPKSLPFLRVGDTFYDPEFKIRKMTGFQAGLSKKWKCKLYRFNRCRRKLSKKSSIIAKSGLIHQYAKLNGEMPDFIRFPIRIDKRSTWRKILMQSQRLGLGVMFTYPDSICGIQDLSYAFKNEKFIGAEELAQRLVTLPVHPLMSSKDIEKHEEFLQKILD